MKGAARLMNEASPTPTSLEQEEVVQDFKINLKRESYETNIQEVHKDKYKEVKTLTCGRL